ncbi:tetratricopeptide repeat protein [Bradyrhizobium diazoefficiens]|uniref:tetratricopeptide repeat protein n=1 Tax=Bradyrhizobium diazoefficiens TaxID=1355477 RepID=UPI00190BA1D8|nr:tetratricopeptide repeat protein [Bradyrhizobium diazoefficiens]QQO12161.1 tetratricopeptide repeat protein [Bradyrhizobium diazoefficiens]
MSELFDEVDEEVRREQLKKLWDKYSIYFIALMVLIVAAVGGWRGYQYLEAKKAAEAGAAFDKAAELSDQNKHAEAEAAFTELAAKAPSGYRTLARLRAAAEAASRDPKAAAKMYDDIAVDRSVDGEWQDLAKIRAAGLLLDTASYADMQQRLEASATPNSTFRHSAREMLALSAWRNNDATAARKWLDVIAEDGETPPGLRSRAEALQALLPPVAKS